MAGSWLGMQAVHEMGHVLGARLTGGEVARVVLYPLTISRTDLARNPNPLVVVWAGPVIGVLLPLALWAIAGVVRLPGAFLLRFFAGFCLVANGAYIGLGSFRGIGDCGEMLRHGSPRWVLWLFGAATLPIGLLLWHGQGPNFGLAAANGHVNRGVAYAALAVWLLLMLLGFFLHD
jgi:Peptidase M50B-like